MNITLELPDDELLEAALRYFPIRDGYSSPESWCVAQILNAAASEEDDLTELQHTWDKNLRPRKAVEV